MDARKFRVPLSRSVVEASIVDVVSEISEQVILCRWQGARDDNYNDAGGGGVALMGWVKVCEGMWRKVGGGDVGCSGAVIEIAVS